MNFIKHLGTNNGHWAEWFSLLLLHHIKMQEAGFEGGRSLSDRVKPLHLDAGPNKTEMKYPKATDKDGLPKMPNAFCHKKYQSFLLDIYRSVLPP